MTKITTTAAALETVANNTKAAYRAAAGTDRSAERIYRAELAKAIARAEAELEAAEQARNAAHAAGGVCGLWAMFVEDREADTAADLELAKANKAVEAARRTVNELRLHLGNRVYGKGPR
jgi:hypothetical protein